MRVKALIEKTENGYYSITSDEAIGNYCLGGYGDSLADAKADFMSVVREAKERYAAEHGGLADEYEELRKEVRKNAAEKRKQKVSDAADAF